MYARNILLAGCVLVFVALNCKVAQGQQQTPPEFQEWVQKANEAFTASNWEEAAKLYQQITEARPTAGAAWYRLGYCLHSLEKYEEALSAHQQASSTPAVANRAYYNWACALARLKKTDDALQRLEQAVAAGFVSAQPISEDPDFAELVENERFQEIAARVQAPIAAEKFREFDFWVGEWDVFNPAGVKVGSNVITSAENGRVLIENWTNTGGGTGMSINYFDPETRKWKQTWVDQTAVTHYAGEFADGVMRFEGTHAATTGGLTKMIMEFTPNEDRSVRQYIRQSTDGGETWTVYFDGKYVKRDSK